MNLNLIEITTPWNDVLINHEKFSKEISYVSYQLSPFNMTDIMENSLTKARDKKIEKYEEIIKVARDWLERNEE